MGISKINDQDLPQSTTPPATATPSVSLAGGGFGFVTATITKSGGGSYTNPNYSAVCTLADGTVTVTDANIDRNLESDGSHLAGTLNFTDTNASTAQRTVTVKAQEFEGKKQSAGATATYTPSYLQKEYIRVQACTSDGSNIAANQGIADVAFFTGSGQSGTEYPTTDLTANDSETDIVVSAGHVLSSTYAAWKAFDSNANTLGWNLQGGADDNWFQIQFEDGTYDTKPLIKSMKIKFYSTYHATHFKVSGSDNADHSSATTLGPFPVTNSSNIYINLG